MQQILEIPFSFLYTHTCTICQLPVTCGPVYVINDLSITCGRCCRSLKDTYYRNYAYEHLAESFIYPCKNWQNYCQEKLRWNESLDHERECDYIGCCTFCCIHPGAFLKGQRDIPIDNVRLIQIGDELLKYLECVNCRSYLSSLPIFIDRDGQNTCHRCIYSNGNPPYCRRNHAYEKFAQIFLFPCLYRRNGCTEILQFGENVWKHESKCEFGQIHKFQPENHVIPKNIPKSIIESTHQSRLASVRSREDEKPRFSGKQKGLVKTHTGEQIWATITPNAPGIKIDLLKSLAEKQKRNIRKANEIENDITGKYSDSESISTIDSSHGRKTSDYSRQVSSNNNNRRPESRESGYQTGPIINPHYYNNNPSGQYYANQGFENDIISAEKRLSHRESMARTRPFINELKIRQDHIKRNHSIRETNNELNGNNSLLRKFEERNIRAY